MPVPRLGIGHTALLVVDFQEKLLPHIDQHESVLAQACRLAQGARVLGVPILATEQYRKGLGATVAPMAACLAGGSGAPAARIHEKLKFSALIEPVKQELRAAGARSVLVCGVETHVCVMQTCLDLMENGFVAALAVDAAGSRQPSDHHTALQRLIQAGVIPLSVEAALFELTGEASGERFKAILQLVK